MKERISLLLVVVGLLVILLFSSIFSFGPPEPKEFVKNMTFSNHSDLFYNYEINKYPSSVEIRLPKPEKENITLGFVIDPWNLNFGIVPANGSYVKRSIELANVKGGATRISFNVFGDIIPLVSFSDNDFILNRGERVTIDVYLFTKNMKPGNYSGEIDVVARKPKYDFIPA